MSLIDLQAPVPDAFGRGSEAVRERSGDKKPPGVTTEPSGPSTFWAATARQPGTNAAWAQPSSDFATPNRIVLSIVTRWATIDVLSPRRPDVPHRVFNTGGETLQLVVVAGVMLVPLLPRWPSPSPYEVFEGSTAPEHPPESGVDPR